MENETKQIMMDGYYLQVDDPVFCLLRGHGIVYELHHEGNHNFPLFVSGLTVRFGDYAYRYSEDGIPVLGGKFMQIRTLYWQEPTIIPPPKPNKKKKIMVADWFVQWPNGDTDKLTELTEANTRSGAQIAQKIDNTEREIWVKTSVYLPDADKET